MLKLLDLQTFTDERGSFTPFNHKIEEINWEQTNVVVNPKEGVFRGMHFQLNPVQRKLIKVIKGEIIDFVYNLETGECKQFVLKENDNKALWVGYQWAHGYLVTQPDTIVVYLVEGNYNPKSERSIPYHQIQKVKTQVEKLYPNPILSNKDK